MASQVKPVPDGYHTVTPMLVIRDAARAIDYYKRAFGAEEIARMATPDGRSIAHAEIRIGNSFLMISDENPQMNCKSPQGLGGSPVSFYVYVEDADTIFKRATAAGAKETMPIGDQFWGDRAGKLQDPFGHEWMIATHKRDLTPEQMKKAAADFFAQMAQQKK